MPNLFSFKTLDSLLLSYVNQTQIQDYVDTSIKYSLIILGLGIAFGVAYVIARWYADRPKHVYYRRSRS